MTAARQVVIKDEVWTMKVKELDRVFLCTLLLLLLVNQARGHEDCTSLDFARRPNQKLRGHVFKELELDVEQCMNKCAESVGCFSINTYQNESGVQQCELLSSTLKASPQDFAIKSGCEYFELTNCVLPDCVTDKEALPDSSYRLKSSLYKLHSIRKTWSAAKAFCASLSGNLASVNSETENKFLQATMATRMDISTLSGYPWSSILGQWKLDGTDNDVTVLGGASFSRVDGMTALYLDGSSAYAEVPAFSIETISFTFACWVKVLSYGTRRMVLGDWHSPHQFLFLIDTSQRVSITLRHTSGNTLCGVTGTISVVTASQWVHIGANWDRGAVKCNVFVDGKIVGTKSGATHLGSLDLMSNSHAMEDIGLKRDSADKFYGYIRDLLVFKKALTEQEMTLFRGSSDATSGTWIGLNDVSSEGSFVWSDGSAVTYTGWTFGEPNDEFGIQDCTVMTRDGLWEDNRCDKELPFICETAA